MICGTGTQCQPFHATFNSDPSSFNSYFIPISSAGSYALTDRGLEMYLSKPNGRVTTSAPGVNDQIGNGATINSTAALCAGKVSYEFQLLPPLVSGVVVAGILIGNESDDEIDIEILGAEARHWQTNVFVTDPRDSGPEYDTFSSTEAVQDITEAHFYSIDVNSTRIAWSLDGRVVRTLGKDQCTRNGFSHFPSHPLRLQMGIWDASSPVGTAKWAGGPIDWSRAPDRITAVIKSVTVECP
ncbi:glycoside hydrolase [Mycena galericulata]|nr:glycoside hydrolase [Mycena galericulata]